MQMNVIMNNIMMHSIYIEISFLVAIILFSELLIGLIAKFLSKILYNMQFSNLAYLPHISKVT